MDTFFVCFIGIIEFQIISLYSKHSQTGHLNIGKVKKSGQFRVQYLDSGRKLLATISPD